MIMTIILLAALYLAIGLSAAFLSIKIWHLDGNRGPHGDAGIISLIVLFWSIIWIPFGLELLGSIIYKIYEKIFG